MTRLQTELRQAWPGSLRLAQSTKAQCLEFVPVAGEVMGRDAEGQWLWSPSPTGVAAAGLSSPSWLVGAAGFGTELYTPVPGAKRWPVVTEPPVAGQRSGQSLVARARSASSALSHSPSPQAAASGDAAAWRYLVGSPVSLCLLADGRLFRYQGYGWHPTQPLPDRRLSLMARSQQGQRQLLARGLLSQHEPFVLLSDEGSNGAAAEGLAAAARKTAPLLQLQLALQSGSGSEDPPLQLNRTLRLYYDVQYGLLSDPQNVPAVAANASGGGL